MLEFEETESQAFEKKKSCMCPSPYDLAYNAGVILLSEELQEGLERAQSDPKGENESFSLSSPPPPPPASFKYAN